MKIKSQLYKKQEFGKQMPSETNRPVRTCNIAEDATLRQKVTHKTSKISMNFTGYYETRRPMKYIHQPKIKILRSNQ